MRDYANMFNINPSLIGNFGSIAATAVGIPVPTKGFNDALAFVGVGGVVGSSGATIALTFKVQESATPTGTNWTDIVNEAVTQGSWKLPVVTIGDDIAGGTTTGSYIKPETVKMYGKLNDGNRLGWIRLHATAAGTAGLTPKIFGGFLMGRPDDTYYLQSAIVADSGNIETSKLT